MASVSQQSLHAALERLHHELQGSPPLDAESRRLLDELTDDITRAREAVASEAHASRLEALAVRFEAGHPDLAASLRGIADALGRVGL
jgi:Domain of unknown function (DUF4404)